MLSGSFPTQLSCGDELGYVDVSSNRLTGSLPSCLASSSDMGTGLFGGNCLSIDTQHQHPESYCKADMGKEQYRGKAIGVLIGVIGGIVFCVVLLLALGLLVLCRRYSSREAVVQHTLPKGSYPKLQNEELKVPYFGTHTLLGFWVIALMEGDKMIPLPVESSLYMNIYFEWEFLCSSLRNSSRESSQVVRSISGSMPKLYIFYILGQMEMALNPGVGQSWMMMFIASDSYLLESLVGPIVSGKGETFLLNEMLC